MRKTDKIGKEERKMEEENIQKEREGNKGREGNKKSEEKEKLEQKVGKVVEEVEGSVNAEEEYKKKGKEGNKKDNKEENPMRNIHIEKITLYIGTGKDPDKLKRGEKLLSKFTTQKPVATLAKRRIPGFGIRPGLPIGVMVTLRKGFDDIIKNILLAKDNTLKESCFDDYGNINIGIEEYIDIKGVKYDPDIGMMGLQLSISLRRKGLRVQKRLYKRSKIGKNHIVRKEEAMRFMKENFGVKVIE